MRGLFALCCSLAALMGPGAGLADSIQTCRALKEQRDALANEAMRAEINLARRYRHQHCPVLNNRAEQANANSREFEAIDYRALLQCREAAERQLERDNAVLYRNRLGFTFYSPAGSDAARRADQVQEHLQGCGV